MKKTFYLLLLSLGTLAACKKSDTVNAVGAVNSNQFTYKVTVDSVGTYNVVYTDSTNNSTSVTFTGKSWSNSFNVNNNPSFKTGYFLLTDPSNIGGSCHLSILLGTTVKASTNVLFNSNMLFAQLYYTVRQ